MCSTDSNLKNELLPVCAGVIQGLSVLRHIHVELRHTILQVLVQLCNLDSELLLRRSEPQLFLQTAQFQNISSSRMELFTNK